MARVFTPVNRSRPATLFQPVSLSNHFQLANKFTATFYTQWNLNLYFCSTGPARVPENECLQGTTELMCIRLFRITATISFSISSRDTPIVLFQWNIYFDLYIIYYIIFGTGSSKTGCLGAHVGYSACTYYSVWDFYTSQHVLEMHLLLKNNNYMYEALIVHRICIIRS